MEFIGVLGLALAIVAIITFSFRGLNMIIAAPLSALIIILCNQMDIFSSLTGAKESYMAGLAGFLIKNFGIFLMGSILGQYMDKSKATVSISETLLSKIGTDSPYKVLVALTLIGAILTFGGISIFVVFFTLIPLARPIFKKLDVNWSLVSIPLYLGAGTFTMSMIPGTPSIQNAIPTTVLNTSLTAAPMLGIIGTVVILVFGLWYMKHKLNQSLDKGETFYSYLDGKKNKEQVMESDSLNTEMPSFITSIFPLVALILLIMCLPHVHNIILIALAVAIVLCGILFRKYIPEQKIILNSGASGAVASSFGAASAVAFGTVLASAPTFGSVQKALLKIPGPPLVSLAVTTGVLSAVMAASGAIGTVVNHFVDPYLAMGIPADVIHRVVVIGGGALTVVPQSGAVITFNSVSGLDFKHGFKEAFIVSNGGFILALIVVVIVAQLFYV